MPIRKPDQIMEDDDLSITTWTGADADSRDLEHLGDGVGHLVWDALQDDWKNPGLFQLPGLLDDVFRFLYCFTSDPVLPQMMDGLRSQPDVAHDRDVRFDEDFDELQPFFWSSFDLYGFGSPFLQEPGGI